MSTFRTSRVGKQYPRSRVKQTSQLDISKSAFDRQYLMDMRKSNCDVR